MARMNRSSSHTPQIVAERGMLEMLLLDETVVAVVHGEGAHAVEQAAPAVKKHAGVAVALQDAGNGFDIVRAVTLYDGVAGQRREGGEHALEAAHGAVAGSIEIGEEHAFLGGELVHFRGEGVRAAQAAPEFGAEAFFEKDDDVVFGPVQAAGDGALGGVGTGGEGGVGLGEEPVGAAGGVVGGDGAVKGGVIEVAGPGGVEEGGGAVAGDFVEDALGAEAGLTSAEGEPKPTVSASAPARRRRRGPAEVGMSQIVLVTLWITMRRATANTPQMARTGTTG